MRELDPFTSAFDSFDDPKRRRRRAVSVARTAAAGAEAVEARLEALDREWDADRVLVETRAATAALLGLALSVPPIKWLPRRVTARILDQARRGWEPPSLVLRAAGIRDAGEIDRERTALKLARGYCEPADFSMYPAWQRLVGDAAE